MEILWLGHPDCHDVERAGAKAANLSRLVASSRVPPGFCLSATAYALWLEQTRREPAAASVPAIPSALYSALAASYGDLGKRCGVANPSVAVRSSAVDEDGSMHSFAGQYETSLHVVGVDAVAEAVLRCWNSAHTERARTYRRQQGMSETPGWLAVLVQQLVPADAAAVVFSANPVTGDRTEVVINASWGLGESIVNGTVTPDTYVIRKADLTVVSRVIAEKRRMTVLAPIGTHEVPVPSQRQRAASLDDGQIVELARVGIALESTMGWPVDIECAYHGHDLYLLQCRPITTLGGM
jgi:pyruvate,water dikinase